MSHQQPQPGWGPPPGQGTGTPAPRRRNTGRIIGFSCLGLLALVVVLFVAVLAIRGGGDDERGPVPTSPPGRSRAEESGARGDVKVTVCKVDPVTRWPSAELLITNRSSKASNYVVHVEFVDASDKRLSEAYASTNGLRPGQQAAVTAQSLDQVSVTVTCRITDVTRYAS
ncbi:FxLYD domain-containing protein [Streptomyces sp. NPDC012637]|uniref:FxLYD domain-containing protein n=1 Tax=Streptomyces sp. NPDC012637 TaxID=3364842 RepID=UPI0036E5B55E